MNELPQITSDFLDESNKLCQTMPRSKKSGPYSKKERDSRRKEVYRLHFDYGFSGRKIAELMKINRNTVNGDIDYWYSKIVKNSDVLNPEFTIIITLQRLEIQRSRLREQLDKTKSFQEKLVLERFLFDIDSKIVNTNHKLCGSTQRLSDFSTENLNNWMKDHKKTERYMTLFDKITVSDKAKERINKIINGDKLRGKYLK